MVKHSVSRLSGRSLKFRPASLKREEPEYTALRELEEETGYTAKN